MVLKIKTIFKRFFKKRYIVLFFVVLLIGFFIWRSNTNKTVIVTQKAKVQNIESRISASGIVSAQNTATLHFASSGKLTWLNVKEGDYVTAGEAIASLDQEKFQIALRQAQQSVVAADAALQKVYDSLPKDKVESFTDKVNRTAAEATKNQAFDAVKEAERQLRGSVIYSPIEGTVTSLNLVPGEEVFATTDIATIADITTKNFKSDVDETDIGKIKEGQEAKIILDAYPESEIDAGVAKIAQSATSTSTGSTAFEVTFTLPQDDAYKIGMNGEAQIITSSAQNVVTIPLEALIDDKSVFIKENGFYTKVDVTKGIESDSDVEITSGVKDGQEVVTSGSEAIGKKNLFQRILPFIFK